MGDKSVEGKRQLCKRNLLKWHAAGPRWLTYPRGTFRAKVSFFPRQEGFWWTQRKSKGTRVQNLFGHGTPGVKDALNIDIQFNIPVISFSRRLGGAFLRHRPTGKVVLAHRGIVTLGHGRIPRETLFQELDVTIREACTGTFVREFLLIGELDSPTLVEDVRHFALKVRRTIKNIKVEHKMSQGPSSSLSKDSSGPVTKLGQYFREYSGKHKTSARSGGVADCYHGDVVEALRAPLDKTPKPLKNREIDLVGFRAGRPFLFEVKTSANTQAVYTAVGQLVVHAHGVARALGKIPAKVIVLPGQPAKPNRYKLLLRALGIRMLTFTRSQQGEITLNGLL